MADLFSSEQGKRLFGFIGAGGTAGALLGPVITIVLSVPARPDQSTDRSDGIARSSGILRPPARVRGYGANWCAGRRTAKCWWERLRWAVRANSVTLSVREEKYKAKNLIDVVIYRGSDALYGWLFDSLQGLGLKLGAIALCSLPVVALWSVLSLVLGRAQEKRSAQREPSGTEVKREYGFDAA